MAGLSWLPAYAPELNPVEQGWNHTKDGELANYLPGTLEQMHDATGFSLASKRYHSALLRSRFHYARLKL
jgi:transposase